MIYFRGCPKCHGDLYLNEDSFGKFLNCLQCGYMRDLVEGAEAAIETRLPEMEPAGELLRLAA